MSAKKKNRTSVNAPNSGLIKPGRLLAIRLLAGLAMVVSAYLAWVTLNGGTVAGCGPESGCDKVLQSRWSKWFGLPVSLVAIGVYSLILGASFRLGPSTPPVLQRKAWLWLLPCAITVAGAALWFIGLQVFVVRSMCPYCMVAHGSGLAAAILLLVSAPIRPAPDKPWDLDKQVFVTPRSFQMTGLVASAALALLVAGPFIHQPKTFEVHSVGVATNAAPASAAVQAPRPAGPPAAATPVKRPFAVYGGRFEFDLFEVPTMASPTNENVIVSLFDYTCHHCRVMHSSLVEVQGIFKDSLCIVSLPMPLDPGCNPTMVRPNPKHTNACDYAKLGLAVWRADRTKHHEFDDWLMTGDKPPALAEAIQHASKLVGPTGLEKAMQDPWVEQQLRLNVGMYELAYRSGRGSMPQLVIGSNIAVGTFKAPELIGLLTNQFALRPPR